MCTRMVGMLLSVSLALLSATPGLAAGDKGADAEKKAQQQRANETAHLEGEAKQVADWLIGTQRAGWERHDYETYITQLAEDGKVIRGRSHKAHKYDEVLNRKMLMESRKIFFRAKIAGTRLVLRKVEVEVQGKVATLGWELDHSYSDGQFIERVRERYQLVKTDKGWRVKENRVWPVLTIEGGKTKRFDADYWQRADEAVAKAAEAGRLHQQFYALIDAWRFAVAHTVAKQITENPEATADDWARRGWMAAIAGDAKDVDPSFARAIELDPHIELPRYALSEIKKREKEEEKGK